MLSKIVALTQLNGWPVYVNFGQVIYFRPTVTDEEGKTVLFITFHPDPLPVQEDYAQIEQMLKY